MDAKSAVRETRGSPQTGDPILTTKPGVKRPRLPGSRRRCADPQLARDRGDGRPLRRVLRPHLSDHPDRTFTELVGVLAESGQCGLQTSESAPPKVIEPGCMLQKWQGR